MLISWPQISHSNCTYCFISVPNHVFYCKRGQTSMWVIWWKMVAIAHEYQPATKGESLVYCQARKKVHALKKKPCAALGNCLLMIMIMIISAWLKSPDVTYVWKHWRRKLITQFQCSWQEASKETYSDWALFIEMVTVTLALGTLQQVADQIIFWGTRSPIMCQTLMIPTPLLLIKNIYNCFVLSDISDLLFWTESSTFFI